MRTTRPIASALALYTVLAATELAAQPELSEVDFVSIGDRGTLEQYFGEVDASRLTTPGPTGTWDFTTGLGAPSGTQIFECLPVAEGPVDAAQHFPGADRVVKRTTPPPPDLPPDLPPDAFPEISEWDYRSCDASGYTLHGLALPDPFGFGEPLLLIRTPPSLDYPLPLTLGEQWTEEFTAGDPLVNEVHGMATVDAWGTAILPGIGPVDCVRVNRSGKTDLSDATVSPPVPVGTFSFREYVWVAKGYGIVATLSSTRVDGSIPEPGFSIADQVTLLVDFTSGNGTSEFIRGEVTGDASLNVGDAVLTLKHLFRGASLACEAADDVDDDGVVTVSDAVHSLRYIFGRGPAPEAPFPACGPDPTQDLPCKTSGCQ